MKVSNSIYYELNLVSLFTLSHTHKGPSFEPVTEMRKKKSQRSNIES